MAKYIESNYGSISAFCKDNGISYLFRSRKNNRTEEKAIKELKKLYEEIGSFKTSNLMAHNSRLERYLRTKKVGYGNFVKIRI
jgi:hypothetical protein